jgi:signal transduction histidine kinase
MGKKKTVAKGKDVAPIQEEAAQPVLDKQTLIYAQELTEMVRQQRQTQAALDRLRITFLGTVNHEMRTPLALIFQALEMLESPRLGSLSEEQLDALMIVRRQVQTLGRMIDSLTGVAAFLGKQETVKPVMARLEPVFNEVLPLAEFKARSKEIAIETKIQPDLPPFPLDVKQMGEALIQLLDNAIKFNRPGGKIKVSARANGHWIILIVSDTGIGIEADRMELIWQAFEQGVDPLRRGQEGLGLGLALARYIISAHYGIIEAKTKLGLGSTFTVKLPRTKFNEASNKV